MMTPTHIRAAFRAGDARALAGQVLRAGRQAAAPDDQAPLLRFDGGQCLSIAEAAHGGLLVIGGPGRGKTTGVVLPAADELLRGGYAGLVIDVKNTFTPALRKLAATAGRLEDLIEIGTHPTATPVNALSGLDTDALERTLHDLVAGELRHTTNFDWTLKGVRVVCDCARVLAYLALEDPRFAPSFSLLDRMTSDYAFARKAYLRWREGACRASEPAQAALAARIESEAFHPLNERTASIGKREKEWEMQLTWVLHGVRNLLGSLCASPALTRNLSAAQGPVLDLGRLVFEEGKVVVLRFSADCSRAGNLVARSLKERFHAAAYRRFDRPGAGDRKAFCLLDEFQDIVSFDDSGLDDFSWVSKSREFGMVNVMATQSLSSLYRHPQRKAQADALVSICSAKLVMQSDDPALDAYLRTVFELERPVVKLGRAEAALIKFGLPERRQEVAHVGFQSMHDRLQALLDLVAEPQASGELREEYLGDLPAVLARELARPKLPAGSPWEPLYEEFPGVMPEDVGKVQVPEGFLDAVRRLCAEVRRLLPDGRLLGLGVSYAGVLQPRFAADMDPEVRARITEAAKALAREYCSECGKAAQGEGDGRTLCPDCEARALRRLSQQEVAEVFACRLDVEAEVARGGRIAQRQRNDWLNVLDEFADVAPPEVLVSVPTAYLPALHKALLTLEEKRLVEGLRVTAAFVRHELLKVVATGGPKDAAKILAHAARSNSGTVCRLCGKEQPRIKLRWTGERKQRACEACAEGLTARRVEEATRVLEGTKAEKERREKEAGQKAGQKAGKSAGKPEGEAQGRPEGRQGGKK
jgi:hypothetical protein